MSQSLFSSCNDSRGSIYNYVYVPHYPAVNGALANHLPMTLVALAKLGAPPTLLQRRYNAMRHGLSKADDASTSATKNTVVTPANWSELLGAGRAYYLPLRSYFVSALKSNGIKKVLADHGPKLFTGTAKGLFHPVIRLYFALESSGALDGASAVDIDGVACALAYWVIRWAPVTNLDTAALVAATAADAPNSRTGATADYKIGSPLDAAWAALAQLQRSNDRITVPQSTFTALDDQAFEAFERQS